MNSTTDLIRGLRATGLTQTEISRMTNIPQRRLSRWEAGEVPNCVDDALKLYELHARLVTGADKAPASLAP